MNEKLENLLSHLETFLPKPLTAEQWKSSTAFRWRRRDSIFGSIGFLQPVKHISDITFEDLQNIDRQRDAIRDNTKNFILKKPANNILLTGARGTGKSSLIKASLHEFASQGLRLVEVEKEHLADLADITEILADRPERFIIFCDDLSFEDGESGYKAMKSALDGSVSAQVDNVLIYATSNRRHLLPVCLLIGAIFLLLIDDIARVVASVEIPIGILTAIVGIPFFILLLRKGQRGWA